MELIEKKEQLVSVLGGRSWMYCVTEQPSDLIPFKGKFPLIELWEQRDFKREIKTKKWIDELNPRYFQALMKADKMRLIHNEFKEYLGSDEKIKEFKKKDNTYKTNMLRAFLDSVNVDENSLNVIFE